MTDYTDSKNKTELDNIVLETIRRFSNDTVYFKDKKSRFIWNSDCHARQLGAQSAEDLLGKTDFDFFPKDFAQNAMETEMTIIATETPILNVVEELVLDDDTTKYFIASKYPLYNQAGELIGTWGTSKDITEQKRLEKELERSYQKLQNLARVDDLSGLYNRRYFYEKLEKLASLYSTRTDGSTFSLIVIDVDDMTNINEQYGQQNGDNFLRTIASTMLNNTRKADTCFRTGGDEFAVVFPDTDKMAALGMAKKIVDVISSNPICFEGGVGKVTISVGLVAFDRTM